MAGVELRGLGKRYGDTVALDGVDLDVHDGEFVVLLGPSGCGKSTVLRLIAGLDRPTSGSVRIGDRVVDDVAPKDRDVAMVFQSYALYPTMTVRKNIAFPLGPAGVPRAEQRRRVEEAAALLDIAALLDRKPAQLSGGQRQRVALARAIVREPRVFLMDEPLSNLDAKLRTQTRVDLVALHRRLGTTFVYVTHDQVEAMTMADRIAILDRGRLRQVGPPAEVYARPADLFVARFIGSPPMNTRPVVVAGAPYVLGVRPEHLRIAGASGTSDVAEASDPSHWTAVVERVESLGHEQHVIGVLDDPAGTVVVVRLAADEPAPAAGSHVRLAHDPAHAHWFAADLDGRRVEDPTVRRG